MINTKDIQAAKNQIKKSEKPIIIKAQDAEFNRKILEYGKFDVLLDLHETSGSIKLKKVESGINHVLAKLAAKNKVSLGIDLQNLRSKNKKEKALALAKIIVNIKACHKAKCALAILNSGDKKNAFAFLLSIGASTSEAKRAISFSAKT